MVDPANPYLSCLVEASAGSGKTHQLSERFLSLVAAGSDPSKILTITFTVKAAGEMRTRIIEKAMNLVFQPEAAKTFQDRLSLFYSQLDHPDMPPPRSAQETGEAILAATQALRVSTIDALFKEWVLKFPEEAGISSEMVLSEPSEMSKIKKQAWNSYLKTDSCRALLKQVMLLGPTFSMTALFEKIEALSRYDGLIYLSQGEPVAPWRAVPLAEESVVDALADDLLQIGSHYEKFNGPLQLAVQQKKLDPMRQSGFLSAKMKVSGSQIKGKKRDSLAAEIKHVDDTLQNFLLRNVLHKADREGELILQIWRGYQGALKDLKIKQRVLEFSDLAKGVHRLFHGETASGVSWLIQQGLSHLLIDEFQDTSRLQWEVFQAISLELLAGQSLQKSVFIVGDRKQSIYGFREADPEVLDEAKETMSQQGAYILEMSKSYRSAPALLDGVNRLLQDQIPDFPLHESAKRQDGRLLTPREGGVWRLPSTKENEVEEVASLIDRLLKEGRRFPISHKGSKERSLNAADIVILYRDKSSSEALELALRSRGISSLREEKQGFFSRSEIDDLKNLLQWLCYSYNEYSLLAFLSGPVGGFTGSDYKALFASESPLRVEEYLAQKNPDLYQVLKEAQNQVDRLPCEILLLGLWRELAVPDTYRRSFGGTEGELAARNLENLLLLAADQKGRLHDFLGWMEESARADDTGNAMLSGSGAVRMMTIHKAKGLEFPFVIVMGMGRDLHRDDSYWSKADQRQLRYLPLKRELPEGVPYETILPYQVKALADEVKRLVYVATTRASQYLVLSSGKSKSKKDDEDAEVEVKTFYHLAPFEEIASDTFESRSLVQEDISPVEEASASLASPTPEKSTSFHIPREITLVSPSQAVSSQREGLPRQDERRVTKDSTGGSPVNGSLSSGDSAKAGVFFHRCLELFFRDGSVSNLDLIWDQILREEESHLKGAYFEMVTRSLGDSPLAKLVSKADRIRTEAAFGRISGQELCRGSMDLVLEFKDEVMVIDYKTSLVDPEQLRIHAQSHGYVTQLRQYMAALEEMYVGKTILGGIWYARPGLLLEIGNDA
ncbi:MAG: UvrD-helicase domain-containing protein [Pseudomonadota bacterium]